MFNYTVIRSSPVNCWKAVKWSCTIIIFITIFTFFYNRSAPESIQLRSDSETTLTVTFVPTNGSTASYFTAKVKDSSPEKSCRVAGDVKPLECTLTGLALATEYTIEAKACQTAIDSEANDACSPVKQAKGMTIPSGEWTFNS